MNLFGFPNVGICCADRTFDRSTIFPLGLVHYGDANDSGESTESAELATAVRGKEAARGAMQNNTSKFP